MVIHHHPGGLESLGTAHALIAFLLSKLSFGSTCSPTTAHPLNALHHSSSVLARAASGTTAILTIIPPASGNSGFNSSSDDEATNDRSRSTLQQPFWPVPTPALSPPYERGAALRCALLDNAGLQLEA